MITKIPVFNEEFLDGRASLNAKSRIYFKLSSIENLPDKRKLKSKNNVEENCRFKKRTTTFVFGIDVFGNSFIRMECKKVVPKTVQKIKPMMEKKFLMKNAVLIKSKTK